jgi:molybdopterin-guanine dinucleotide biosynthesis protein A
VIWDAIILAGGKGSRLGGFPKGRIVFDELSLLDRAVQAVAAASSRVVVGNDYVGGRDEVVGVHEFPRWGGPAAAIAAGLSALPRDSAPVAVILAADLPHVDQALPLVTESVDADGMWDGWIAMDGEARAQPLLAAYRRDALARRCATLQAEGGLDGASMRQLLRGLRLRPVVVPTEFCRDVDTAADALHFAIDLPTRQECA